MSEAVAEGRGQLLRALSLRDAAALVVGTVIGTGIFLKTAPMAQLVGSPSLVLLAWLAAGLLSLAGALTYAELGGMLPRAGGEYVFLREAYGDIPAFLFGWATLTVIATGSLAANGNALAAFLSPFFPVKAIWAKSTYELFGETVHWRFGAEQLVAVTAILFFSAINAIGVAVGGRTQQVLTAAKVIAIAFIVVGVFAASGTGSWSHLSANRVNATAGGASAFGAAMLAALWAYQGWSNVSMVAGEIENPERNVPRSLIYGMTGVLFIYLLTNIAYFYALPFSEVTTSYSTQHRDALPLAAKSAFTVLGDAGVKLVSVAFVVSVIGNMNGIVLMNARVPFAMARDGIFFARLGDVGSRSHVPVKAIWVQASLACLLALSGTFDQITTASVSGVWFFFALAGGAVFVLRRKLPNAPRPYRTIGYPVVPALFVLVAVWLVVNSLITTPVESGAGLLMIALGLPFYFHFRKGAR